MTKSFTTTVLLLLSLQPRFVLGNGETVASRKTVDALLESKLSPPQKQRIDTDLLDALNDILGNVPTVSPEPTQTPTESPAPSPSPSAIPTGMPTSTPEPTAMPSESPTDSPAPSPSPSEMPSFSPSASPSSQPSLPPSNAPSLTPSASPSVSAAPSDAPSSIPSASPSDYPSASPSDTPSQVPSASPSASPSDSPSISPSDIPSMVPSEYPSAAPSAAPSDAPSSAPSDTPSQTPSATPSTTPSDIPSASPSLSVVPSSSPSAEPSTSPSLTPSSLPSASPTLSRAPSDAPSMSSAPSSIPSSEPSDVPSSQPTRSFELMTTSINLLLEHAESMMDKNETAVFEETARQFMQDNVPEDDVVDVTVLSVVVTEQTNVIQSRSLETDYGSFGRKLHADGLSVNFDVTGKVSPSPPPDGFSFEYFIGVGFADNFTAFEEALAAESEFFAPLVEADEDALDSAGAEREETNADSEGMSSGESIGIIVGSVAALSIAIVASVVSLRKRRSSYIEEEEEDENELYESQVTSKRTTSRYSAREVPQSMSGRKTQVSERPERTQNTFSPKAATMEGVQPAASPNTMENGAFCDFTSPLVCPDQSAALAATAALADAVIDESKEPDEETVRGPFGFKLPFLGPSKLLAAPVEAANAVANAEGDDPGNEKKKHMGEDDDNELRGSKFVESMAPPPPIYVNADNEGEIEIAGTPHSTFTAGTMTTEPGMLGARQMDAAEESQYHEATSENLTNMRKVGLYDVFAPPGPLGIVVDTSHDGPIIHSMKPNSALLGLVSPGDIIVGLDDMDTRSMTAATLTRLMAKRSLQPERKITLLAVEVEN